MQRRNLIYTGGKIAATSTLYASGLLSLASCGGGGSGGGGGTAFPVVTIPPQPPAAAPPPAAPSPSPVAQTDLIKVYTQSNDPRILGGWLGENERYVLQGTKNAGGKPLQIIDMQFFDVAENATAVQFARGAASQLVGLEQGIISSITLNGSSGLIFGLSAGDRQLQINLPTAQPQAKFMIGGLDVTAANRSSTHLELKLSDSDCGCFRTSHPNDGKLIKTEFAPIVEIEVKGCVGENPIVQVLMRDEAGKFIDVVYGQRTGTGKYVAVLKNLNTSDQAYADAAEALKTFIDEIDITEGAFISIFAKLKSVSAEVLAENVVKELEVSGKYADTLSDFQQFLGLTDAELAAAEAAAKKRAALAAWIAKRAKFILKTVDIIGRLKAAFLAGDLISKIINADAQDKFNGLQLQAKISTNKGAKLVGTSSGIISPNGPYPNLAVSAPDSTDVSTLVLVPVSPGKGQGYAATGQVFCLQQGDIVTVSVVGTDGYSNSVSETAQKSETQAFTLNVPGANTGVRDVVTIQVKRNATTVASRTASLVFG